MSVVYKFRLTKVLHDQMKATGRGLASILARWDDTDYACLCEYVTQCRKVVPKYVGKLSEFLGESPRAVIAQIVKARADLAEMAPLDSNVESAMFDASGVVYLPEDKTDRASFLQKYCGAAPKQYY